MKVLKIAPTEKLVQLSKSEPNFKEFRQDQPVSNFLRKEMVEVHQAFLWYMRDLYFDDLQSFLKEFIDELHPREEKRKPLEENLFWWKILYDARLDDWDITEGFINENHQRFMDKDVLISWLKEWNNATTKFYFVGHNFSNNNFLVIDLVEEKMLSVIVNDTEAAPPKAGEIVIGTLIPVGEGLYTPITDFYRFDYEAREVMGGTFKFYYDKYSKTNSLPAAFIHVFSIMMQIERRIYLKIKRAK